MKSVEEQTLIERWIDPNPRRRGAGDARLKEYGVPIWALVGDLPVVDGDVAQLAAAFEVPLDAVQAALAYYRRHKREIDIRLAENSAHFVT